MILAVLIAVAVTASMAVVDYAHARYSHAIREAQLGVPGMRTAAVRWTLAQYAAASIGFAVAVGISLWYLPFEGLGLGIGTWFGSRKRAAAGEVNRS